MMLSGWCRPPGPTLFHMCARGHLDSGGDLSADSKVFLIPTTVLTISACSISRRWADFRLHVFSSLVPSAQSSSELREELAVDPQSMPSGSEPLSPGSRSCLLLLAQLQDTRVPQQRSAVAGLGYRAGQSVGGPKLGQPLSSPARNASAPRASCHRMRPCAFFPAKPASLIDGRGRRMAWALHARTRGSLGTHLI